LEEADFPGEGVAMEAVFLEEAAIVAAVALAADGDKRIT
jgi:hypothetical protein